MNRSLWEYRTDEQGMMNDEVIKKDHSYFFRHSVLTEQIFNAQLRVNE